MQPLKCYRKLTTKQTADENSHKDYIGLLQESWTIASRWDIWQMRQLIDETFDRCDIWRMRYLTDEPYLSDATNDTFSFVKHLTDKTFDRCNIWHIQLWRIERQMRHLTFETFDRCNIWQMRYLTHATFNICNTWQIR